jgi:putative ABC transport system substrate-binding protein
LRQSKDGAKALQATETSSLMPGDVLKVNVDSTSDAPRLDRGRAQDRQPKATDVGAVLVGINNFYSRYTEQLAALAARHALPAIYPYREQALAGGLMSYGSSHGYASHQVGIYAGRILKGEKPSDLPVQQATKLDLVINLKTAKALGLTIPETLLATADEVIQCWAGADNNRTRALAQELVGLQPEIIVTSNTAATVAVQRETSIIPIVFADAADPVASGIVERLDRPTGNVTGFAILEAQLGGKWLELLSEIAPGLKRGAIMFNPDTSPASLFVPSFETAARSLNVAPITAPIRSDAEVEAAITALGREPGGGLVVISEAFAVAHRAPIILAAARNNLPAVYSLSAFARDGGLLSYGVDQVDLFRRAASYVDRVLRGAKPADLPIQFPTKFEMAVNLKTAKALGLTVPQSILLRADEIIE